MFSRSFFFVCLLLWVISPVQAAAFSSPEDEPAHMLEHPQFMEDVQRAINLVYNQDFEGSVEILEPWFNHRHGSALEAFWQGLPGWWEILADLETDRHDAAFIRKMEETDRACDQILRRDRRNLDAMVIKSLANGFLARLYSNRGSWYKSLTHGRLAINILFSIEQLYPDVPDIQFGLGLYNYFTAHLNEEYRLVRAVSWMIPGGDKSEGLERLARAAEESAFMIPESTYFLGHIYLHYEQNTELAEKYITRLLESYPHNPFFNRLMLRTMYQQRDYSEAARYNDELLERFGPDQHKPTLEELYTLRGMIAYRLADHETAELYFDKAIALENDLDKGELRHHQMMAQFYMGRTYNRTGRNEDAKARFRHLSRLRTDAPVTDTAKRILDRMD